jgi:6-phosphogluconate dehydrogenase
MNSVLDQLLPELERGDLVMDAGIPFSRTRPNMTGNWRNRASNSWGSASAGGEQGARQGAIVMAGGGREARQRARPLLEAMAATVRGEPCVSYFETAAAAHFVKMVHTGVEYALLAIAG